jgi:uncharacterized protein (UPF0303 family)
MVRTTGGFNSTQLLKEERNLCLKEFNHSDAVDIGEIAKSISVARKLPVAIEVRISNWIIYHLSLPGSTPENDYWINRKARVVALKQHSTMYERVDAEERGVDWYKENNLPEELFAIHGGGFPLITHSNDLVGVLLISGLPQVEDHLLAIEVLTKFLSNRN